MNRKTLLPLQLLFTPDRNDPNPLVIYHGQGCPDLSFWVLTMAAFDAEQVANFMARGQAMDEKFNKLAADIAEGAQPHLL